LHYRRVSDLRSRQRGRKRCPLSAARSTLLENYKYLAAEKDKVATNQAFNPY
jgi:hypothetical protein